MGLSQKALAQACGVSLMTQHRLETVQPSLNTNYLRAAQDAGVNISFLLTGEPTLRTEDWQVIRACVADVAAFCGKRWADCPDDHRWVLVKRLYERRVQLGAPQSQVGYIEEIELLLGIKSR